MTKAKKKLTSASDELMQALNITSDDLAANNDGYITDHQRETLLAPDAGSHGNHYAVGCLLSLIGVPFLVLAGIFALLPAPITDVYYMLAIAGVIFSIGIFTGAIGRMKRRTLAEDLERNEFNTMQGIAIVHLDENNSTLEINDVVFNPDKDVLLRIRHLEPYIIHYLTQSKVILSMEHIPDNPNLNNDSSRSRLDDNVQSQQSMQ